MSKLIRVLHVYKTGFPDSMGGVEQVIDQLARGCKDKGVQSTVLFLSDNPKPSYMRFNGYDVYRVKSHLHIASTRFSFSAFAAFSRLAKEADIIHYQFPWPFMDLMHFICRIKKPTIVSYQSDIIKQKYLLMLYKPLMHRFLKSVNAIVAASPNYIASSEVLQKYKDKTTVIPIGIDKKLYPVPDPERLRFWADKFGKKFFLFVGAMRYYKGLHVLLEAAHHSDIQIVIAGKGYLEQELRAQAQKLNLDNVHFTGAVSDEDKIALLQACYGFVFPSHERTEAFGISLLEAAMYGKPLISCEIGTGTTFINRDKETGLVVPPNDSGALRQAMQYLITHPKVAKEMGARAEERYWQVFTGEQQTTAYVKLYQKVLSA